jgi:adenosylcobinamide-GDP ribazoletransferase
MGSILAAFQFLTVLPVRRGFSAAQMAQSVVFFPVVGLVIGLVLAAVNFLLSRILPTGVVNVLLVALLAFCHGGLHLDGLADTLDGAAGHRTVERRLEIMRDSRIGGFGAIGLIIILLMQYVFLNHLPADIKWLALIAAPVISRWMMAYAIFAFPYARPEGLGKAFKDGVSRRQFIPATIIMLVITLGLLGAVGLSALAGALILCTLAALYLKNLLRGLTGDCYGALNELAVVTVWLVVIILAGNHGIMNLWWY